HRQPVMRQQLVQFDIAQRHARLGADAEQHHRTSGARFTLSALGVPVLDRRLGVERPVACRPPEHRLAVDPAGFVLPKRFAKGNKVYQESFKHQSLISARSILAARSSPRGPAIPRAAGHRTTYRASQSWPTLL